jgi:hypothetical protein
MYSIATKTIKFNFDAGNDDRNVACDFVRVHGGTGSYPCSGGLLQELYIVIQVILEDLVVGCTNYAHIRPQL